MYQDVCERSQETYGVQAHGVVASRRRGRLAVAVLNLLPAIGVEAVRIHVLRVRTYEGLLCELLHLSQFKAI